MEDDAVIPDDFEQQWEKLWPWIPEDWDVMRIGYNRLGGTDCRAVINQHMHYAFWLDPPPHGPCQYCGLQAYVVNPASGFKILQRIQRSHIFHPDNLFSAPTPPEEDPKRVPPLLVFASRPVFIGHDESDFESDRVTK